MIYLDYQATTPIAPEVAKAMHPWIEEKFANPHSPSRWGHEADAAIEVARKQVEKAIGVKGGAVAFTGSATEALNWALKGTIERAGPRRNRIITIANWSANTAGDGLLLSQRLRLIARGCGSWRRYWRGRWDEYGSILFRPAQEFRGHMGMSDNIETICKLYLELASVVPASCKTYRELELKYQLDKYGVALLMIASGASPPDKIAQEILDKFKPKAIG